MYAGVSAYAFEALLMQDGGRMGREGGRLPAGGGRGAQRFGVNPAEGIQPFLNTSGAYPECLPVRKLSIRHLPF